MRILRKVSKALLIASFVGVVFGIIHQIVFDRTTYVNQKYGYAFSYNKNNFSYQDFGDTDIHDFLGKQEVQLMYCPYKEIYLDGGCGYPGNYFFVRVYRAGQYGFKEGEFDAKNESDVRTWVSSSSYSPMRSRCLLNDPRNQAREITVQNHPAVRFDYIVDELTFNTFCYNDNQFFGGPRRGRVLTVKNDDILISIGIFASDDDAFQQMENVFSSFKLLQQRQN